MADELFSVDVTTLLQQACNDLVNHELIHGDDFNLFEGLSDMKVLYENVLADDIAINVSVDEAIKDGVAPVPLSPDRTVNIQRIVDVMDHILVCEATWHERSTLAQTMSTCIYVQRPEILSSHALLQSFCRVTKATCDAIVSFFSSAYTNDEKLRKAYYGSSESDAHVEWLSMLEGAEEKTDLQLKACRAASAKNRIFRDVEPLQTNPNLEEGFCIAVLCRLRFRKHFYCMLTYLRRPRGEGLDLAKKHITSCLSELQSMLESQEFLSRSCTVSNEHNRTTASGCQPVGFVRPTNCVINTWTAVNPRFLPLTCPRSVELLSWKEALQYFKKLLLDLEIVCSNSLSPVLEKAVWFLVDFHKLRPDLVATTLLQLLMVQDERLYGREPIFATICKSALLPERAKCHVIQKHKTVEKLGTFFADWLKVSCVHLTLQRGMLAKMLPHWHRGHLELESVCTGGEYIHLTRKSTNENVFSMKIWNHILLWVEEQKHWFAFRFLLMGFDLELYSPSEYCMAYWYIYDILSKLIAAMIRKEKRGLEFIEPKVDSKEVPYEVLLLQCYNFLAEGLIMIIGLLRNEHKAFLYVGPYNTEKEIFVQHFQPLHSSGYPLEAGYAAFQELIDEARLSTEETRNPFKEVWNPFEQAQKMARMILSRFANDLNRLNEVNELRKIDTVTQRNGVALNILRRLDTPIPDDFEISFDFNYHPQFGVFTLKRP